MCFFKLCHLRSRRCVPGPEQEDFRVNYIFKCLTSSSFRRKTVAWFFHARLNTKSTLSSLTYMLAKLAKHKCSTLPPKDFDVSAFKDPKSETHTLPSFDIERIVNQTYTLSALSSCSLNKSVNCFFMLRRHDTRIISLHTDEYIRHRALLSPHLSPFRKEKRQRFLHFTEKGTM